MTTTIYIDVSTSGSRVNNPNKITITPNAPTKNYILIEFVEKQNCNNVITALFRNTTTNCTISEVDIVTNLTPDLVNGVVFFDKAGIYAANIYYQESSTNLNVHNAKFAYTTGG